MDDGISNLGNSIIPFGRLGPALLKTCSDNKFWRCRPSSKIPSSVLLLSPPVDSASSEAWCAWATPLPGSQCPSGRLPSFNCTWQRREGTWQQLKSSTTACSRETPEESPASSTSNLFYQKRKFFCLLCFYYFVVTIFVEVEEIRLARFVS